MNREEIIRMAREAGWDLEWGGTTIEQVQSFAALVAAYVRETEFKLGWTNYWQGCIDGAAAEREACARVCEQVTAAWSEMEYNEGCMDCAEAIRARGDA